MTDKQRIDYLESVLRLKRVAERGQHIVFVLCDPGESVRSTIDIEAQKAKRKG